MSRKYLVTGGAGFIGSNFIRHVLDNEPGAQVTNLDLLTYAGVKATVDELDADDRHTFVQGDIRDHELIDSVTPRPRRSGELRRRKKPRRTGRKSLQRLL